MRLRSRRFAKTVRVFLFVTTLSGILLATGCGLSSGTGTLPISVTITNKIATIAAGAAATTLNATVQSDSSNSGVTWSLTAGGTACSPTCGSLSGATSTSVTYTPPATSSAAPNNAPTITASSVKDSTKSDSDAFTITALAAISVTITNKISTIFPGATAVTLTAQVQNDASNSGVTWTLAVAADGAACSPLCGSLTGATTTSVTYTPPGGEHPDFPNSAPRITATAVKDTSQSDTDNFSIVATTVTITNKLNAMTAGSGAITFQAVVRNDPTNSGVGWSLTAGNVDCSPTCGTLSNVTPTSATYVPPTTVPAVPNNRPELGVQAQNPVGTAIALDSDIFTIIAGAVSSCAGMPTGHESRLNGQYAFFAEGLEGHGLSMAGSFAPDGTGKITDLGGGIGGEIDRNAGIEPVHGTVLPTGSLYTVGPDPTGAGDLGCLQALTTDGSFTIFRFSLAAPSAGVSTRGKIIEYDDQTGNAGGNRISGVLMKQDPTAFASGDTSHLQAQYAFGVHGSGSGLSLSAAGYWQLNPATGAITKIVFDSGSAPTAVTDSTATITSVSSKTGRALLLFRFVTSSFGTTGIALYIVNANELFLTSLDPSVNTGLNGIVGQRYSGRAIVSGTNFTSAALSGNFIFHFAEATSCSGFPPCPSVTLGAITLTPAGNSGGTTAGTLVAYSAQHGVVTASLNGGLYTIDAASGRVTLSPSVALPLPVLYLAAPVANSEDIQAFGVGSDLGALFGLVEPGAAQNVATSSLAGNYFFGDEDPGATATNRVGVVNLSSVGVATGTEDDVTFTGLVTTTLNYTVTIDNASGPGTGNVGANTFAITNGTKLFFFDENGGATPSITVVERQ
jgi:hypothetical protein